MDERMVGGDAGRQHHSRSISIRRLTMWESMCLRLQMAPPDRGVKEEHREPDLVGGEVRLFGSIPAGDGNITQKARFYSGF